MSFEPLRRILRSAGFRLALGYAALFVVSAGALFATVYYITTAAMQNDMAAVLRTEALQLAEVHARGGPRTLIDQVGRRMNFRTRGPIFYLLQAPDGRVVIGNLPGMPPTEGVVDFQATRPQPDTDPTNDRLLGFGVRLGDGSFLLVAQDASRLIDMQRAIVRAFAWAGGLTLLLGIAGGVFMGNNFLRRIDQVSRTSRAIMEGDLSARVATRGTGDEFDQLAAQLNAMLDRIQALMTGLRQVSSDIAHDLRTPLSRLRQHLEATDYDKALAEADAILETFSALLRIAQIESGAQKSAFAPVDLSALARSLGEAYTAPAEDAQHKLIVDVASDVSITGDRQLLAQLISNLIENALAHTPQGSDVRLVLRPGPRIEVSDTGPGIPESEHAKVFDRFYRLDRSRGTPGSGLGLALVKAIANLHGLSVRLENRHPGLAVVCSPA
jgi:signal transduction histidine kinase